MATLALAAKKERYPLDFIEIIVRILPYAAIALVFASIFGGCVLFLYKAYRKKGGTKEIQKGQFLCAFLLLGWSVVVVGLTTLSRGANYEGWVNFRLFSGYINAWNHWSLREFQLIIFNVLMFLPLGFLLPLLSNRLRRFWPVMLISLIATTGIELFQMLSRRGIFELDDIFHNTLGSVTGYLIIMAILACVKERGIAVKSVIKAIAVPLLFATLFSGASILYNTQKYGNMPISPAIPQKMDGVLVESSIELSDVAEPTPIYYNSRIGNMEYMKQIAGLLEDEFSLWREGGIRIDGANRQISYLDDAGEEYYYTFFLESGTWSLTHDPCFGHEPLSQSDIQAQVAKYEQWMMNNSLLPADAAHSIQNEDTLRWDALPPADKTAEHFFVGQIIIFPALDHGAPCSLWCFISENDFVGTEAIVSPAQAYEMVLAGQFQLYNDLLSGDQITVTSCELEYIYDTKGYYRPIYRFEGTVNNEPWGCSIPAME